MRNNNDNHQDTGNGWSGGFLFGLLVGITIALLFTTKKGKKILKVLTDEGLHKLSNWEDLIEKLPEDDMEEVSEITEEENDEYMPIKKEVPLTDKEKISIHTNGHADVKKIHSPRRLFKGIPKKN